MNPQYIGIVHNEQTSDGSGLVVITSGKDELGDVILDVLSDRVKNDIEDVLYYSDKDPSDFDHSRVPDFVKNHTEAFSQGTGYSFEPDESQYENDLGLVIEENVGGLLYNVEIHDVKDIATALEPFLDSVTPNEFIYLHELEPKFEIKLKELLNIIF